jgi:folate-binding Fe-S cluster repair protein YgfZ
VVGRVGTVATHHELGPIALALLKRSVEPTTPLLAGGVAASIDPDSVPPDNGEPPGRAALRRLRA